LGVRESGYGVASGLLLFGGLLDLTEDLGDLALEEGEFEVEDGAAGVKDDVHRGVEEVEVLADGLAQPSLDAVAVDGLAHDLADGEADAGRAGVLARRRGAEGEEVGHLFRELFAARLVDALVVGVFAKAEGAGEHGGALAFSLLRRVA
jgi:hypothetical protein